MKRWRREVSPYEMWDSSSVFVKLVRPAGRGDAVSIFTVSREIWKLAVESRDATARDLIAIEYRRARWMVHRIMANYARVRDLPDASIARIMRRIHPAPYAAGTRTATAASGQTR